MALPRQLLRLLHRQLGLVARAQVLAAGVPRATLHAWLLRGALEPVEWGVYRLPGTAVPKEQRILAALLRAGDRARATGWSACALYGLEGFDLGARPWVAIPKGRRVRGVDFIVERTDLERCDLATVAGLPAVTPIRALIDAAERVDAKVERVGIDDARGAG
ncbi:MAG: type IV toxin-antitoxin system AbiEi family antitoxin domain-containing protein [Actinobacteria bacterium]|nr:type IV toxin-antitoxin system AbiEi family antitoxin domain-containing protein [Actinomycetota bacterium]